MNEHCSIAPDVKLGKGVKLSKFINLYGCEIGDDTKIGAFVEIQKNASVGRQCKISSHTFVCEGVTIEDNVFIGHGVMFINDIYPRATAERTIANRSRLEGGADGHQERSVHRHGRHDPRQRHHRRKCDRRRGQRGHQGRARELHRRRKSSKSVAQDRIRRGGLKVSTENGNANGIPFLDLVTPHVELEQELTKVFQQVLHTAGFIGGPMVENFEKAFAEFCSTSHSVAVSSGTDALRFAIMGAGIQPGDVIVTVPHTFIATT